MITNTSPFGFGGKMPVDKAFDDWVNIKEYTEDEMKFAKRYKVLWPVHMTKGFYAGYQAGQKSLSPEVLNLLERIKYHMRYSPGIYATDITAEIEKLLAKE